MFLFLFVNAYIYLVVIFFELYNKIHLLFLEFLLVLFV